MSIDFSLMIGGLFLVIALLIMTLKLNDFDFKFNKVYFIFCVIVLCLYLYISYLLTMSFVRYILFLLVGSIIISRLYKINILKVICTLFFSWLIFLISECIFTVIIGLFFNNIEIFYGSLISNMIITVIAFAIFSINKLREKIKSITNKMITSEKSLVFFAIFILAMSFSIILYINYFNDNITVNFILSLIIIVTQLVITILLFLEKNIKQNIQCEYNALLNNLNEYEKMLDFQKVANHENKNQLLVIKGMIKKNEKNVDDYIDSIIKEQYDDNEEMLYKTNKIPEGGLRGLVYYKILKMKDNKINISLEIDRSVQKVSLESLGTNVNKDVCKIIGVFLDNSIQAVEKLDKRNIKIRMNYEDDKFIITITNNFEDKIDMGKIEEPGYTTKGKGHGYGLSLVKKIVSKYDFIENKKMINGNVFTQELMISIKK